MSEPIYCPQCGFPHTVYLRTDDPLLCDVYACTTCFYEFVVNQWWPDDSDDDVCAANEIIDDEDAAYAPPADSREGEW